MPRCVISAHTFIHRLFHFLTPLRIFHTSVIGWLLPGASLSKSPRLFSVFRSILKCCGLDGPVGWGCRIHLLNICREIRPPFPYEFPVYDSKQSHGEAPGMLELWGMRSTPSLPSLSGPLWSGEVAPDWVLSMRQIDLNCVITLNWIV